MWNRPLGGPHGSARPPRTHRRTHACPVRLAGLGATCLPGRTAADVDERREVERALVRPNGRGAWREDDAQAAAPRGMVNRPGGRAEESSEAALAVAADDEVSSASSTV